MEKKESCLQRTVHEIHSQTLRYCCKFINRDDVCNLPKEFIQHNKVWQTVVWNTALSCTTYSNLNHWCLILNSTTEHHNVTAIDKNSRYHCNDRTIRRHRPLTHSGDNAHKNKVNILVVWNTFSHAICALRIKSGKIMNVPKMKVHYANYTGHLQ